MLNLYLLQLSFQCSSKMITDLFFSSANKASEDVVRKHFTTYGVHKSLRVSEAFCVSFSRWDLIKWWI